MKTILLLALTITACGNSSQGEAEKDFHKNRQRDALVQEEHAARRLAQKDAPAPPKVDCKDACEVVSLSNAELKARFGTNRIPFQYKFAARYADGAGFKAYSKCLKEPGNSIHTKSCTTRALAACTQACVASGR